jgi:arylsulfatase A-like enzyme
MQSLSGQDAVTRAPADDSAADSSRFSQKARQVLLGAYRLRVNLDVIRQTLLIVLPLAAAVLGIKAYKIIFALWPVTQTTLGWHRPGAVEALKIVFASPLTLFLAGFLMLALVSGGKTARTRLMRASLVVATALALLYGAKFAHAIIQDAPLSGALESYQVSRVVENAQFVLSVYRGSVLFVLLYGCLTLLLLSYARSRVVTFWVLQGVSILFVIVGALELAHYLKTGLNGSGPLLIYALKNSVDLAAIVNSELDEHTLFSLALPFVLWGASYSCVWFGFRRFGERLGNRPVAAGYAIWTGCLYVLAFPVNLDQQYLRFSADPFTTVAYDLAVRPIVRVVRGGLGDPVHASPIPELRFVPRAAAAGAAPLRNVVIVMLESVRASATTVYDSSLDTTPFLAQFARRSAVVDDMYAVVPRTAAAWIAILHGTYPGTNTAMAAWALKQKESPTGTSLPRLLGANGYATAFYVAGNLAYENEGQLIRNMGFQKIVTVDELPAAPKVNYFGVEDKVMLKPMMQWVDDQTGQDKPFFLSIMTNVGHHKYQFPTNWKQRRFTDSTDPDYNNYLNCVAYIDDFLRELVGNLESRGLMDSTLVLIVGDHGDAFGEHGARQHAMALYEETLHVPMIIHAPGTIAAGRHVQGSWQQVDILPTVADVLGFDVTGGSPIGSSLLAENPKRKLFFTSVLEDVALAAREGDEKFVYSFGRQPTEVYNLARDPQERNNLFKSTSHERLAQVEEEMRDWYESSKLTLLLEPAR